MQRVTYYDSTLKQYVFVGNEHDTLTALGKLEDSLEKLEPKGLIVIRYYLALRGAENGVTAMVTPFFCVQG